MNKNIVFTELSGKLWKLMRFIIILGLGYVILNPIIYMLSMAFRPVDQMMDPSITWIPRSFTTEGFTNAFKAMKYLDFKNVRSFFSSSFITSMLVGGVSAVIQLVSCSIVGYGFARFKYKGSGAMFAMVMISLIIPTELITIPMFNMAQNVNIPFVGQILNEIFGLSIPGVKLIDNVALFYIQALLACGIRGGLYIYIFRQFFRGIPKEIEEAATVDGSGYVGTFTRIMVPNAGAAFLTVFLFSFVWYWNDYYNTTIFLSKKMTVSMALSMLKLNIANVSSANTNNPYEIQAMMQAGCILAILPMLILYVFLQKYFVQGIERTGIVG